MSSPSCIVKSQSCCNVSIGCKGTACEQFDGLSHIERLLISYLCAGACSEVKESPRPAPFMLRTESASSVGPLRKQPRCCILASSRGAALLLKIAVAAWAKWWPDAKHSCLHHLNPMHKDIKSFVCDPAKLSLSNLGEGILQNLQLACCTGTGQTTTEVIPEIPGRKISFSNKGCRVMFECLAVQEGHSRGV